MEAAPGRPDATGGSELADQPHAAATGTAGSRSRPQGRYSTNHQVVIDADTRLVVVVGRPLPGNRYDCRAWAESGAKAAVEYLSARHRDNPDDGCPSAALDEIGRSTDATKQAYTDGVLHLVDDIAARLAPDDPPSARVKALSILAQLAGTLQLSRALADRRLSDQLLEQAIHDTLTLIGLEQNG